MQASIAYMFKRTIMHVNSARIKEDRFKNKPKENHSWPWVSLEARNFSRLVIPVLATEFFIFPRRLCDFARFHDMLDEAISKIGRF